MQETGRVDMGEDVKDDALEDDTLAEAQRKSKNTTTQTRDGK